MGAAFRGLVVAAEQDILAAANAAGFALMGFKKTVEEVSHAIERASRLYNYSVQNSFAGGYAAQHQLVSYGCVNCGPEFDRFIGL